MAEMLGKKCVFVERQTAIDNANANEKGRWLILTIQHTLCVCCSCFFSPFFFSFDSFHSVRVTICIDMCNSQALKWCVCVCAFLLTQSKVALCGVGMSLILLFVCSEVSVHSG